MRDYWLLMGCIALGAAAVMVALEVVYKAVWKGGVRWIRML